MPAGQLAIPCLLDADMLAQNGVQRNGIGLHHEHIVSLWGIRIHQSTLVHTWGRGEAIPNFISTVQLKIDWDLSH
jgi:hypothetical protein